MKTSPHITLPISIAALALSLPAFGATTTLLGDTTFIASDWSTLKARDTTPSGDAAVFADQYLTGGNPTEYRHVTHDWEVVPTGVIISFAHLNQTTFTPSFQGSIDFISFAMSVMCDYAPIVNAIAFGALVQQDGVIYIYNAASATAIVGSGWTNFAFNNLTASDFTDAYASGTAHPDFSSAGTALRFGFWSANGGSGFNDPNHVATGGLDNFLVTADVTPVPEPSGLTLLALSVSGALTFRRRRPLPL